MPKVRMAIAQTNPTVGDIFNNLEHCLEQVRVAAAAGAKIVVFGEMAATGYPIEDLASRPDFVASAEQSIASFARQLAELDLGGVAVLIGHPASVNTPEANWANAQNCASVLLHGKVYARYAKHHLPNYSVFDEYRNFVPGTETLVFEHEGLRIGVAICEDIWQLGNPVAQLINESIDLTIVLNGSPFELDKDDRRMALAQRLAFTTKSTVVYANLIGGQDDLVFDGYSFAIDAAGKTIARAKQFETDLISFTVGDSAPPEESADSTRNDEDEWQIWSALVLGLRDYVEKNGFKSIILGLSGGIDSAVCAAIAVDAIGPNRVYGVSLPSKYSSEHSKSDALDLATRLGLNYRVESIAGGVSVIEDQLQLTGVAGENLQARVRAVILMAISNAEGQLLLTTGNKTEISVGYSTIYGDSAGGFAPLRDVKKTLVWQLAEWRNAQARALGQIEPIPPNSISKPPSAELRPDQVDQDSLPEYDTLDAVLEEYVTHHRSFSEIVTLGFEPDMVARILKLVDNSEWKRRQGAIGPKISTVAFGRDRRLPITNKFDAKTTGNEKK